MHCLQSQIQSLDIQYLLKVLLVTPKIYETLYSTLWKITLVLKELCVGHNMANS